MYMYRFLARGDDYISIGFSFRLGHSTVCNVVRETCKVIYDELVNISMCPPKEQEWLNIAEDFKIKWNFPNCIGGIDGKHVMLQAPPSSGSQYFNYKGSHSIVLMALVDANYKFVLIDVGGYGRNSDGGILANSSFGKALFSGNLSIPDNQPLAPNKVHMPHVIVGDEAFPVKPNLMRPYPGRNLQHNQRIFNYRLSRARRVSENAFGILAARWRFLRRLIQANPDSVVLYVKAACVLHNFLIEKTKNTYCPPSFVDQDFCGVIYPGEWRNETQDTIRLQNIVRMGSNNPSRNAVEIRDQFCNYFVSENGSLPWQNALVLR